MSFVPGYYYRRTLVTRTLKGNKKQRKRGVELSGSIESSVFHVNIDTFSDIFSALQYTTECILNSSHQKLT